LSPFQYFRETNRFRGFFLFQHTAFVRPFIDTDRKNI
jgi:hypothetical protein